MRRSQRPDLLGGPLVQHNARTNDLAGVKDDHRGIRQTSAGTDAGAVGGSENAVPGSSSTQSLGRDSHPLAADSRRSCLTRLAESRAASSRPTVVLPAPMKPTR